MGVFSVLFQEREGSDWKWSLETAGFFLGHWIIQTVCKVRSVKLTNWKSLNPPYTLGFIWRPRAETTSLASANMEISLPEWSITPVLLVWTCLFSVLREFLSALGSVSTMTSVACSSMSKVTCKFPPHVSEKKVFYFVRDWLSRMSGRECLASLWKRKQTV